MTVERVQIIGNIARFEQRESNTGMRYVKMDVAVDRWKADRKTTNWYYILLFGANYEAATKIAHRYFVGRQVYVEGRPNVEMVSGKDGPRIEFTIVATAVPELLGYQETPKNAATQSR